MKAAIGFLFFFQINILSYAQHCLSDGITFQYQSEINQFPENYPGCRTIDGFVSFNGDDITNLDSLIVLESIQNELILSYIPQLESLSGLNNINHLGSLFVETSSVLDFKGLENLESIDRSFFIEYNYYIKNFDGLQKLKSIGLGLVINVADELESFMGLDSLKSIGALILNSDKKLEDFSGLESLRYLKGLEINHLSNLKSFDGLNSLDSITEYIQLWDNDLLSDLKTLEKVDFSAMTSLAIYDNDTLSECSIKSICDYLARFGSNQILDNNPGCNSSTEVLEGCLVSANQYYENSFSLFPNPTQGILECNLINPEQYSIKIFDLSARLISEFRLYNNSIDVSSLPSGFYFLIIQNEDEIGYYPFVKSR